MTVYVLRDGRLVEKGERRSVGNYADFPTPMLSRMEPFESPVTGKEISSWRERDRDMASVGACDRRDLPSAPFEKRAEDAARRADTEFEWR